MSHERSVCSKNDQHEVGFFRQKVIKNCDENCLQKTIQKCNCLMDSVSIVPSWAKLCKWLFFSNSGLASEPMEWRHWSLRVEMFSPWFCCFQWEQFSLGKVPKKNRSEGSIERLHRKAPSKGNDAIVNALSLSACIINFSHLERLGRLRSAWYIFSRFLSWPIHPSAAQWYWVSSQPANSMNEPNYGCRPYHNKSATALAHQTIGRSIKNAFL